MTTPKEPNFFSDDEIFARGLPWYENLFDAAASDDLKGEASTHYTKLPTYPNAAARLHAAHPDAKLIYLTRDPVERLVSHHIHEWTMGNMGRDIEVEIASSGSSAATRSTSGACGSTRGSAVWRPSRSVRSTSTSADRLCASSAASRSLSP